MKKNRLFAISGSTGYIAKNFIKSLKKKKIKNIRFSHSLNKKGYLQVQENFQDINKFEDELKKVKYFFHFAYFNYNDKNKNKFKNTNKKNILMIRNIVENIKSNSTFIFLSSTSVYGSSKKLINEKRKTNPLSYYDRGKLNSETYIKKIAKKKNLNYIILRIPNVYGNQSYNAKTKRGIIPFLIEKIINNEDIYLNTDGLRLRDYLHISDLNEALLAVTSLKNKTHIYNLVSGKSFKLRYILDLIVKFLKLEYKFHYKGKITFNNNKNITKTDNRDFVGSNKNFKYNFNWKVKNTFEKFLRKEIKRIYEL